LESCARPAEIRLHNALENWEYDALEYEVHAAGGILDHLQREYVDVSQHRPNDF
jgi:hypothetical protein